MIAFKTLDGARCNQCHRFFIYGFLKDPSACEVDAVCAGWAVLYEEGRQKLLLPVIYCPRCKAEFEDE